MASRSRSWVSSKCLTKQPGHCSEAAMEHFINTDLSSSSVKGAVKGGFMNTRAALKSCPLACWQGSASFRSFGMFQNSCRTVLMPWQVISILTFACIDLFVWFRFSLTIQKQHLEQLVIAGQKYWLGTPFNDVIEFLSLAQIQMEYLWRVKRITNKPATYETNFNCDFWIAVKENRFSMRRSWEMRFMVWICS